MGLGDSSRATMEMGALAVGEDPALFREVMDLSFSQPYPVNMRTARVVEICCEENPERILPYLEEVIEKISISTTDGVKRSYLKIIDDYTGIDAIEDPGRLLQICFDWLLSPSEAASIRYHSLGILLKITGRYPELIPELISALSLIIEEGNPSPGLENVCKKSLKMLRGQLFPAR